MVFLVRKALTKDFESDMQSQTFQRLLNTTFTTQQGNKNTKYFCKAIALIEDSHDKASAIKDQKLGRN